jgi:hypothetical protein
MTTPSLSALRSRLDAMPLDELRRGHREAVMRFALAGSLEACREAHEEALAWSEEFERRTSTKEVRNVP